MTNRYNCRRLFYHFLGYTQNVNSRHRICKEPRTNGKIKTTHDRLLKLHGKSVNIPCSRRIDLCFPLN